MSTSSFNTQYDFLFVGKDEGSFVENYAYDLGEGGENSGKLFICLEISQNNADPDKIGDIIFDKMRKVFFADGDIDGYERFEESLKEVNHALEDFKRERGNDWLGKMNVVISAVVNNNLYLTQCGEAEAYLIRKRLLTTISDDLYDPDSKDVFTNIASGEMEDGDHVVLSTTRLLRYVSKNDLAKEIHGDLNNSLISIKEFLHGEVVSKIGLVMLLTSDSKTALKREVLGEQEERVEHIKEESYFEPEEVKPSTVNDTLSKAREALGKIDLSGVKNIYNNAKSKVSDLLDGDSSSIMGRHHSKLQSDWSFSNWGKDKILLAIIAMVIILSMGVWWLRAKADEDRRIEELAGDLVQVQEQVNSAVTTGQFDKDRAGDMLNDAEQKAIIILNSGYHKSKARELLDTILETRDKLDGVMRPEVEKMADLSEKRANVSAIGLVKLKDALFAFEYNALYPILLDKVLDPLTIDDNEKVISGINYDDKESVLFFTEDDKVIEYKDDRMSFLQTGEGNKFNDGVAIQAYSNKIYILDPANNQIWRYTRRRDSFDSAEPYASDVDLSTGVDLAIDGNIYVLGSDGTITKLFQGSREDFVIKKEPVKPLTSPTRIFTEAEMSQIYVLEPSENRVLVYNKDDRSGGAVYTGQYIFDELDNLKDVYVDKDTNTMYVLTENAIYRFNM